MNKPVLYIAPMGAAARAKALSIVSALRARGYYAECDISARSLKAQMKYADKLGARYTLIIGDSELESGRAQLKDMAKRMEWRDVEWNPGNSGVIFDYAQGCYKAVFIDYAL